MEERLLGALGNDITHFKQRFKFPSCLKAETTRYILIYNSRFSQAVLNTSDVQELEQKKSQAPILGSHFVLFLILHLCASFTLMAEVIKTHGDVSGICL